MDDRSRPRAQLAVLIAASLGALVVSGAAGRPDLSAAAVWHQTADTQDVRQTPGARERGARGDDKAGEPAVSSKAAMLRQQSRRATVFSQPLVRQGLADDRLRPKYVPGHIVVKFAPSVSARDMQLMAREVDATRLAKPSYADFYYVRIPADVDPVAAAARLAEEPDVVYAEPDAMVFPTYVPNDPYYKYQWHFKKIGMEQAWDVNHGASSKVIVAVVDTGVAYLNKGSFAQAPDLAGTSFVAGYDFVWDTAEPIDFDGHGTHVTGTIAQTTNNGLGVAGMAFNAKIMPVKVLYTDWDETWNAPDPYGASTTSRGIRYAVDHGAKVINLSLGSLGPNTATRDAIQYAVSNGVFVAIAAGNEALRGNAPVWPASYAKNINGAVAVAALDYNLKRAPYSSIQDYVEIAAPGGDASVDVNGDGYGDGVLQQTFDPDAQAAGIFNRFAYVFYQGTSMATPHVAALAAMMIDQGYRSPGAIEAAMKQFATDIAPTGRDNETGYGVINPRATLRGLGLRK
jgi:serine protease